MAHLTIREASRLIERSPATIRRYIRSGRLKADKEIGRFGEEYKIRREDLLALGFSAAPASEAMAVQREPVQVEVQRPVAQETMVPVSLFNDLLMKHEQLLVQYGMIRAGGQKLLEYKADAEAKDEALAGAEERYQALRARAVKEIRFLRKHLRQGEIEVQDRNIEIVLLQEKIKRLDRAAAGAALPESLDKQVGDIRDKERAIARMEASTGGPGPDSRAQAPYEAPEPWFENYPKADRGEDN
jgi:hypothetical protein